MSASIDIAVKVDNSCQYKNNVADRFKYDQNGYPLEVPIRIAGSDRDVIVSINIRNANIYRPKGRYVVLYDGEGEMRVSGQTILNATPGRFEVDITTDNFSLFLQVIRSKRGNHIRNIRFLIPGTEATYIKEPFYKSFLERASVATVLRFMPAFSTNGSKWTSWDTREQPNRIGSNIWTYEESIDLCNRLCIDYWATVPHAADSAYIATLANLVKERLRPELKVYLEYSNEVWNSSFEQSEWIDNNTPITPTSTNSQLARAQRVAWHFRKVFRIWRRQFGDQANRVIRVAATQGPNNFYSNELLRALGNDGCDAVAANYYINPMRYDTEMRALLPSLSEDVIYQYAERVLRENLAPAWRTLANTSARYGYRLISYEAGQHFWELGLPEDDPLTIRLSQVQSGSRMYNLYQEMFDTLRNQGSTMFNAYNLVGPIRGGRAFGHLQHIDQPISEAPKYQALLDLRSVWNAAGGRTPSCSGTPVDLMPPSSMWLTAETGANAGEINLKWADGSINWKRPYDNEGVVAYDFYADGELLLSFTEVNASNTVLKGLQPGKEYKNCGACARWGRQRIR